MMTKIFDKNWLRRGYELKHLFLNRPIRPFHLAVAMSTGVVGFSLISQSHPNKELYGCYCDDAGHLLGWIGILASFLLFLGWFVKPEWKPNQEWFAEWGLLLAVGVWVSRSVYVLISDSSGLLKNPILSSILSLAWAIGAGGAYLLERYDHALAGEADE